MTDLVNRTLYRALLRATHNGQRPEILSIFGSVHAYINSGISSNLPALPNTQTWYGSIFNSHFVTRPQTKPKT
jgi:hypothetical protein